VDLRIIILYPGSLGIMDIVRRERFDVIESLHLIVIFSLTLCVLAGVPVRVATHHGIIENIHLGEKRYMPGWSIGDCKYSCGSFSPSEKAGDRGGR